MPVCGFNDIPTQIASYCVPDDLSHRPLTKAVKFSSIIAQKAPYDNDAVKIPRSAAVGVQYKLDRRERKK